MGAKHGSRNKLYYNSGTNASPTWVLIGQVGDVSIPDLGIDTAEVAIRDAAWNLFLAGNFNASVEFNLLYNAGNTVFDAMRTGFFARDPIQFAVLDGLVATAGTQGLKLFALLEKFPINQPIKDKTDVPVRLVPAFHEESSVLIEPTWMTVSS